MKKQYNKFLMLFTVILLLSVSCSDDKIYVEGVAGIALEGVEGNVINMIEDGYIRTESEG